MTNFIPSYEEIMTNVEKDLLKGQSKNVNSKVKTSASLLLEKKEKKEKNIEPSKKSKKNSHKETQSKSNGKIVPQISLEIQSKSEEEEEEVHKQNSSIETQSKSDEEIIPKKSRRRTLIETHSKSDEEVHSKKFVPHDFPIKASSSDSVTKTEIDKNRKNFSCKTCGKNFYDKSGLNRHTKTAKYCLDLRDEESEIVYKCNLCGKNTFSIKCNYDIHVRSCKNKFYVQNYEVLEEELHKFKELLEFKNEKIEQLDKKLKNYQGKNKELKILAVHLEKQLALENGKLMGVLIYHREEDQRLEKTHTLSKTM